MSCTVRVGSYRGEGGELSGRAVAFNRWLPLFAEAVGSQGGRTVEALTPRRFRDTNLISIECGGSSAHPSQPHMSLCAQCSTRAVTFTPNQHKS